MPPETFLSLNEPTDAELSESELLIWKMLRGEKIRANIPGNWEPIPLNDKASDAGVTSALRHWGEIYETDNAQNWLKSRGVAVPVYLLLENPNVWQSYASIHERTGWSLSAINTNMTEIRRHLISKMEKLDMQFTIQGTNKSNRSARIDLPSAD